METGTAFAANVNFGCEKNDRVIAATAYYAANGPSQWHVTRIVYSYGNSGGGESNTRFRLYNGSNAVAWTWSTPDDRTNRRYRKRVNRTIRRGNYARVFQRTWFDTFGNDPKCSYPGYF